MITGNEWLAGFHAIEESLSSGDVKGEILYAKENGRISSILKFAEKNNIPARKVGRNTLDKIAGKENHRGILLVSAGKKKKAAIKAKSLEGALEQLTDRKSALVLILDGITDPQNLGAILRSADLFDVDLVITPHRGSAQENATVKNASAGASSWVPLVMVPNLTRVIETLRDEGFWTYGAHMDGEKVDKVNLKGRTALVMGSEGKGIRRLVTEACDGLVSIPTGGHIDSLNVSVATGILLYETRRQGS